MQPIRVIVFLVLQHQPPGPFPDFRGITLCLFITTSSQEIESQEIQGGSVCFESRVKHMKLVLRIVEEGQPAN